MLSFYFLNERYIFNPQLAVDFLSHIWATEPLGMLSVGIMLTSLLVTLSFKMFDLWNDARKERARQGRLRIELCVSSREINGGWIADNQLESSGKFTLHQSISTIPVLEATIANVGQEPVVIRDIGYARKRLLPFLGAEFIPVTPANSPLPHALNARDLVKLEIPASLAAANTASSDVTTLSDPSVALKHLQTIAASFQVRDSLGKRWPAPEAQSRLARRQLNRMNPAKNHQPTNPAPKPTTPSPAEPATVS